MRTPLWESSAGALASLLNSHVPLNKADLYRVTLAGGQVIRWSGHDLALTVNGELYSLGPGIERTRCRWSIGVEVDSLTIDFHVDEARPALIGTTPLLAYAAGGGLDGATVELIRAFWGPNDAGPVGTLLWFKGAVSEMPELGDGFTVTVKSSLEKLNVMVPRQLYQAQCLASVYDPECGLSRAAFTAAGAATSAASLGRTQFSTNLAHAAGRFDLGTLTFTSGANDGVSRTVKTHAAGGGITVLSPLPAQVTPGDAFTVVPGCDGLQATCSGKFNNLARFKGQPYIPKPETVL